MEKNGYSAKREMRNFLRKSAVVGMTALMIWSGSPATAAVAAIANAGAFPSKGCTTAPTDHSDMYLNPTLENVTAKYGVFYGYAGLDAATANSAYPTYSYAKGASSFGQFQPLTSGKTIVVDPFSAAAGTSYLNGMEMWGYVLVFVKANPNYLFTNLATSGLGNVYALADSDGNLITDLSYYENLGRYPNLLKICEQAKKQGFTAVFGWTKWGNDIGNLDASFTAIGQQPGLTLEAKAADLTNAAAGQTITFDLKLTPQDIKGLSAEDARDRVTKEEPKVTSIYVGSKKVTLYDYHKADDGTDTYVGKVDYKLTAADIKAGSVTLKAAATLTYDYILGAYVAQITSSSTVNATGSQTVSLTPEATLEASGWTYDGTFHADALVGSSGYPDDGAGEPVYTFTDAEGNELAEAPVDAGDYSVVATWNLPNGKTVTTDSKTFTIAKRMVSLASPDAQKVYDGTSLVDANIVVGGEGFVEGDSAVYDVTGTQTEVGSSRNFFTYEMAEGTLASNYVIEKTEGTLTVTPKTIVTNNPDAKTNFSVTAPDDVVYDGTTRELKPVVKDPAGNVLVEGVDYQLSYSADTVNAGAVTVTVAGIGNYDGQADVSYRILQRPVTLASASAEKVYDGTALVKEEVAVGGMGFVKGEAPSYTFTGSQTDAGSSDNTFTYAFPAGVKASNYYVSTSEGELLVTPREIVTGTDDAEKDFVVEGLENVKYNGEEQAQKPVVKTPEGVVLVEGTDYDLVYSEDVTNAGTVTVTVVGKGNYSGEAEATYEIEKRQVTLTSGSAEKVYDGTGLAADYVTVSGDGFVEDENPGYTYTAPQVDAGEKANDFTYAFAEGVDPDNYEIETVAGTLVVTPREIVTGTDDAEKDFVVEGLENVKYNGEEQAQKPVVKTPEGVVLVEGVDYDIVYSDDVTNAGTVTVTVVGKGNYSGEAEATYEIEKRQVTLESAGASKVYDGTALTDDTVTESGDGFVDGETPAYDVTGSQTEVGSSANAFTYAFPEGVNPDNYEIAKTEGTLTVEEAPKVAISVKDLDDVIYNGSAREQKPVVTDPSGKVLTEGVDYELSYSDDTVNAGVVTVTVTGVGGYDGQAAVSYNILKRPVTLASASAEKVYDGTPLVKEEVAVGGLGFVKGEAPAYTFTGSQTDAGSSANTFACAFPAGVNPDNYYVSATEGALVVTPREIVTGTDDAEKDFVVEGLENVKYDGTEQAQKPVVKTPEGTVLVEGVDYDLVYSEDVTNAGTVTVTVVGKGNYSGEAEATYDILKRTVLLASPDAEKVYDGTALTSTAVMATGDGFVDGEGAVFDVTGSQTDAGSSSNTFAYALAEGTLAANYEIAKTEGTLTVTPREIATDTDDPVEKFTVDGLSDTVYNGESQVQKPVVTNPEGDVLIEGVDYDLVYSEDTTNAGTVTVTVQGKGNYTGSVDVSYQILKRPVLVTSDSATKIYDGTPLTAEHATANPSGFVAGEEPVYTFGASQTDVGSTLNQFTYAFPEGVNPANYEVTLAPGTLTVQPATIEPGDEDKLGFTVVAPENVVYNGSEQAEKPVVKNPSGEELVEGVDYDLVYSDDTTNAGTVTVTVQGKGNYAGSIEVTYQILKRPVLLTSASATKVYDGTTLVAQTVTASENGFVAGEEPAYTFTGSQTDAGASLNTFAYEFAAGVNPANYEVAVDTGILRVTPRPIVTGTDDVEKDFVVEGLEDVKYDGDEHAQKPVVKTPEGTVLAEGVDYDLVYSDDVTNAGTVTVTVVGKGNYEGQAKATYDILKRQVTLTSGSAEKAYDGAPLTDHGVTVGMDGFVAGEEPAYTFTGTQTEVGASANTFDYALPEGVLASNYAIEVLPGTLDVTPAPEKPKLQLVIEAPADTVYNGESQPQKPVVKDPEGNVLVEGEDYTLVYPDDTTNAGEKTVQVVPADDPDNPVETSYTIAKRTVVVTSDSASKVYDGTPLTAQGVTEGGDGFVAGEAPAYTFTNSQTEVGQTANMFTYAFAAGVNPDNYTLTLANGTLEVTPAPAPEPDEPAKPKLELVVQAPEDTVYDGTSQPQKPVVTDPAGNVLVEGEDYTLVYPDDTTNAGEKTVQVVPADDPDNPVETSYTIAPRVVGLASASAVKPYDGTPLSAPTVTVSGDGFVAGEEPAFDVAGAQTEVGWSYNAFTYVFGAGVNSDNYTVEKTEGTLEVTEVAAPVTPDAPDPDEPGNETPAEDEAPAVALVIEAPADTVYDGTPQPQKPVVKDPAGNVLVEGVDYTLVYPDDVVNAGIKDVLVVPVADPDKTVPTAYTIAPRPVSLASASATKVYDGAPLTDGRVTVGLMGFVEGQAPALSVTGSQTDAGASANTFTYAFGAGVDPANYDVTVTYGTLAVSKAQLVVEKPADVVYNGEEQPQKPVVKDSEGNILEEGKDYTLVYPDDVTNPGEKPVQVVPVGDNYIGGDTSYDILPDPSNRETPEPDDDHTITADPVDDVVYTGQPQEPKPVVKNEDGKVLEEGKDYTLSYEGDTTNPGTVRIVVTGIGEYEGLTQTVAYRILPAEQPAEQPSETVQPVSRPAGQPTAKAPVKTAGKLVKTADPFAVEAVGAAGGIGAVLAAIGARLRRKKQ
jgi:hypothetical protein